jgi:hypothetical protein
MVGPTTKAPSKRAFYLPEADKGEIAAKVSKRKAGSAAVKDAPEVQANTVQTSDTTKTKLAVPSTAPGKKSKQAKKEKVVRDSFTMPKSDYDKIAALKLKCADSGVAVKKSELLRAGLLILATATAEQLIAAVGAVETVKTGRPEKT